LLVDNFAETFRFYRDALGFKTGWSEDGPYAEFQIGSDKALAIFDRKEMAAAIGEELGDRGADTFLLAIEVDDVDAWTERLRAQGIPIVAEPAERPDWSLRTVHIRDPEGNLIELYFDRMAAAGGES
jgi:catechol 2,3-dioxygenase-like lactoylglutathione lyase family enzyme